MQTKIILIDVTSSELFLFSWAFLQLIQIKYFLFQQGGLVEHCKLPRGVRGGAPFRFYIASNPSKAVKNII